MKPTIVTLTGPACSGKSTLEKLLAINGFAPAISTTTRTPRDGETDGVDYHFVDRSHFEQMHRDGHLIEHVEFNGSYYGLGSAEISRLAELGKPATVVCEPQGAQNIYAYAIAKQWECVRIFIDCPVEVLLQRYLQRFLNDYQKSPEPATISIFTRRLVTIVEKELLWTKSNDKYDLIIEKFTAETQSAILRAVREITAGS